MMRLPTHRSRLWRRFLSGAALGVVFAFVEYWTVHKAHLAPAVALENWGMDVMTRLTGTACSFLGNREPERGVVDGLLRCSGGKTSLSTPLLVEVDDAAWRDPSWAGGEPERAPKGLLGDVVFRAFELGARIVVLDVLIEPRLGDEAAKTSPDLASFVQRIQAYGRDEDRRLVLVRSERSPLPEHTGSFLGELRGAEEIDKVVAESKGAIIVAAPYFQVSSDRITRDWDLFRVTCERLPEGDNKGLVRIVPSVQLVVEADRVSRIQATKEKPLKAVSPAADAASPCTALPRWRGEIGLPHALDHERLRHTYWNSVYEALHFGSNVAEKLPQSGDVANRVIFRLPAAAVDRISVLDVGTPNSQRPAHLERLFQDRIVVVGQTYAETADFFDTPVGRMPGALLLVNAIDSMSRHGMARSMPDWLKVWVAPGLFILIVAYCFARWNSAIGTFVATLAIILIAGLASFAFWARGGWLSFVAPLIGIQIHSWWAAYEERRELDHLTKAAGGRYG